MRKYLVLILTVSAMMQAEISINDSALNNDIEATTDKGYQYTQERKRRLREQRKQRTAAQYARGSHRHITDLGFDASSSDWGEHRVWYKLNITISDGSHLWASVDRTQGCYSLLVGSNDSNIYGGCSNCSTNINGNWSCASQGRNIMKSLRGSPAKMVDMIAQYSYW
jgi:hypothetical protein